MKYAHDVVHFILLCIYCCGYIISPQMIEIMYSSIHFSVSLLAHGHLYDCQGNCEIILTNIVKIDGCGITIKHSKEQTMCIIRATIVYDNTERVEKHPFSCWGHSVVNHKSQLPDIFMACGESTPYPWKNAFVLHTVIINRWIWTMPFGNISLILFWQRIASVPVGWRILGS